MRLRDVPTAVVLWVLNPNPRPWESAILVIVAGFMLAAVCISNVAPPQGKETIARWPLVYENGELRWPLAAGDGTANVWVTIHYEVFRRAHGGHLVIRNSWSSDESSYSRPANEPSARRMSRWVLDHWRSDPAGLADDADARAALRMHASGKTELVWRTWWYWGQLAGAWAGLVMMLAAIPMGVLRWVQRTWYTAQVERYEKFLCPQCGYAADGWKGTVCPECGRERESTWREAAEAISPHPGRPGPG